MDFDLQSTSLRILECAKCDNPVAGERSQRVSLRCGYCNFEDVRELSASRDAGEGEVYRGRRPASGARVSVDLERSPNGIKAGKVDALRAQFVALKHAPVTTEDEAPRLEWEHRLLWLATSVAAQWIAKREFLRARAIYETTLEEVSVPAYRALLLARLSRLAAMSEATDLAAKWLAAVPEGLRIPEVTSDVRVAEAMIARARGDHAGVLTLLGERNTADTFTGPSRFIALALRIDAHEKLGHDTVARTLWRDAARAGPLLLGGAAAQFALAPKTRRAAVRRAFFTLPLGAFGIWALLSALAKVIAGEPNGVAIRIAVGMAVLLILLVLRRR